MLGFEDLSLTLSRACRRIDNGPNERTSEMPPNLKDCPNFVARLWIDLFADAPYGSRKCFFTFIQSIKTFPVKDARVSYIPLSIRFLPSLRRHYQFHTKEGYERHTP